jgi:hypothetical protein
MRDHWRPRPEWTAGARYVTWHLLPDVVPAMVGECHRALAGLPGLDPVPDEAEQLVLAVADGTVDVPDLAPRLAWGMGPGA